MEKSKTWLITGICGQDGSWFADYLLELGYTNIHGIIRRSATFNTMNIEHIFDKLKLHHGDLTDPINIHNIISQVRPDYIVNFAAQSHVKVSHDLENYTFQVNTLGILHILQSVRILGLENKCRIYHASTSEMYGNETDGHTKLNEISPMHPVSIYGISKLAAQQICNMYRDAYGMFIVSSILFNHEGSRRGHTFVTQKIVDYVAKYAHTVNKNDVKILPLQLGNLNAKRDWGDAKDYMRAIYMMLRNNYAQNYVIATGETHSVREFVELAFKEIDIDIEWVGEGLLEQGVDKNNKDRVLIQVNSKYYRDIDIDCLIGDASKAKSELCWEPQVAFKDLIKYMVSAALKRH
jgi:GDPmannose 4,6-dehydratase